ncbi:hypothetical protein HGI30_07350 [Paenibacillus albicereus]|uniref:ABC transporter permease n=1 Tax=Paenibacillus albicereus TaxID=2726185 RepID=A0A6H2GVD9_9BACL|nr:ABC transporter permease [Paenibacillus albicereus]QJC51380.1 hypothetical protein HGI30_07350 [Paenibacillus albicereus]
MDEALDREWRRRALAFYKDCLPFLGDMARSGLPLALFALIIVGSASYAGLLERIPADFPAAALGTLLLAPVLYWSPMRTWLQPADLVFLLPREAGMKSYLRRSWLHTLPGGLVLAAAVLLLYWPIRAHVPADRLTGWTPELLPALAAVLALKALASAAAWRERQIAWRASRSALKLLRLAITAWLLYVWFTQPAGTAALVSAPAALLWWAASRLPKRLPLPWERLIEEERRTASRYIRFFGWFTEVPSLQPSVHSRPWLSWIASAIPLRKRSTYTYLYSLSIARTELGGMLLRMTLLGMLCCYWLGDSGWLEGWAAAACVLLFLLIAGLQSAALTGWHRHVVWRHVYPLPESGRLRSAAAVDRSALTAVAALLWLAASVPLLAAGHVFAPATAALLAAVYVGLRPRRLLKRQQREEEEE